MEGFANESEKGLPLYDIETGFSWRFRTGQDNPGSWLTFTVPVCPTVSNQKFRLGNKFVGLLNRAIFGFLTSSTTALHSDTDESALISRSHLGQNVLSHRLYENQSLEPVFRARWYL